MWGYLRPAGQCRIYSAELFGHRTVVLENRHLRVGLLVDRGAAPFEILWKPGDVDLLWRWERGIRPPLYVSNLCLTRGSYQDQFFGGWDLMFPAVDVIEPNPELPVGYHGEVAMQPWQWTIEADSPDEVALRAVARCTRTPFEVARTFRLTSSACLELRTTIRNVGAVAARFAAGEHIALPINPLGQPAKLSIEECGFSTPPSTQQDASRLYCGQRGQWPVALDANGDATDLSQIGSGVANTTCVVGLGPFAQGCVELVPRSSQAPSTRITWNAALLPYLTLWMAFGGDHGPPWFGTASLLAVEPMSLLPWDRETATDTVPQGGKVEYAINFEAVSGPSDG